MRKVITQSTFILLAFLTFGNSTAFAVDPVFTLNGGNACVDSPTEVNVTLGDFTNMISFQFTVAWNPTVIQINEVSYVNPAISNDVLFGSIAQENDVLTVSWFDSQLNGVTIADDEILFTISFNAVGGNSAITNVTFEDDPTMREVSADEGNGIEIVSGTWNNSSVSIAQPELADVNVTNDVDMSATGSIDMTISNGTAPYTYAWASGQTTEDIFNLPMGDYSATITDATGCVTEVGPFSVDNTVAVNEISGLINVQLYPNPTSGNFNLKVQLENAKNLEVNIFNILGENVYFEQTESANIDLDLDLSDLAIGNYFVQLKSKDGMHVQKVQIIR